MMINIIYDTSASLINNICNMDNICDMNNMDRRINDVSSNNQLIYFIDNLYSLGGYDYEYFLNTDYVTTTISSLIQTGADINIVNNLGFNALMVILPYCDENYFEKNLVLCIENKININHQNNCGLTLLMMMCQNHQIYSRCIDILLNANVSLDIQCNKGFTALMYLMQNTYLDIRHNNMTSNIILKSNVNIMNHNNETAFQVFTKNKFIYNILSLHDLRILKGEIRYNNTKSAIYKKN